MLIKISEVLDEMDNTDSKILDHNILFEIFDLDNDNINNQKECEYGTNPFEILIEVEDTPIEVTEPIDIETIVEPLNEAEPKEEEDKIVNELKVEILNKLEISESCFNYNEDYLYNEIFLHKFLVWYINTHEYPDYLTEINDLQIIDGTMDIIEQLEIEFNKINFLIGEIQTNVNENHFLNLDNDKHTNLEECTCATNPFDPNKFCETI
ncbi:hypothetical protein HOD20_04510 [archaeon]|nr:hypothetical protein [archaeon]MBT4351768.1 hypothetical protein [archaeon]MBT4647874.1 hypothetical protein [archaeon]MBT6821074.1 hypothetical protein [archaeon]MBT7392007.1 hypothetical protein [archaeon]